MTLSLTQLQTIKADILANDDMNTLPNNSDGSYDIARLYNQLPIVPMNVWKTNTDVNDIYDQIDFSKYTPVDSPDSTTLYTNRAYAINIKQMNLQTMLIGRSFLNTAKVIIRSSLRDAVIAVPAGTGGANVSPGGASGVNVLNTCTRLATRIEKLLVNASQGSDTTGTVTARVMGFEGTIQPSDIDEARAS